MQQRPKTMRRRTFATDCSDSGRPHVDCVGGRCYASQKPDGPNRAKPSVVDNQPSRCLPSGHEHSLRYHHRDRNCARHRRWAREGCQFSPLGGSHLADPRHHCLAPSKPHRPQSIDVNRGGSSSRITSLDRNARGSRSSSASISLLLPSRYHALMSGPEGIATSTATTGRGAYCSPARPSSVHPCCREDQCESRDVEERDPRSAGRRRSVVRADQRSAGRNLTVEEAGTGRGGRTLQR